MTDSVILNSPIILFALAFASALCLFDVIKRPKSSVVAALSAVAVVGTVIYSILSGAQIAEAIIILLIFALPNMTAFVSPKTCESQITAPANEKNKIQSDFIDFEVLNQSECSEALQGDEGNGI